MPTAGEFTRQSQNDVDISDFENIDAASSDDETLIIDPDILDVLADLPPKNQWTEHLVEYPVICSQRESLAEQYGDVTLVSLVQRQRNIFILDFRFLSISINVVVLCVVIIIYLYLFS